MEIFVIGLLTIINALFSVSEIALVSVKPTRMQSLAAQGDRRAQRVLTLLAHPEAFLSAIQVGITLIGIFSGAFGGAVLTDDLASLLVSHGMAAIPASTIALVIVIGTITYFTVVVGELVPKTLALRYSEAIALRAAYWVALFTRITYPLVKVLAVSTQAITRVLGIQKEAAHRVSAEELLALIHTANLQGLLDKQESQAHQNLLVLDEQPAKSLMTPRRRVEWIDSQQTLSEIVRQVKASVRSKYPVANGRLDQWFGIVNARDLLDKAESPNFELSQVVRPSVVFPDTATPFTILEQFRSSRQYMGVVVDEHGHFEGVLTLHDLAEAIVGDLPTSEDENDQNIVKRPDGSWLISGRVQIGQMNAYLESELIQEDVGHYTTVAGYFLSRLKCIPKTGTRLEDERFEGQIVDMDGHRIDKVLITPKN